MSSRKFVLALGALVATGLAACGGDGGDDGGGGGGGGGGSLSGADGAWRSACFDTGNGVYEQELLEIDGGAYSLTLSEFADAACTTRIRDEVSSGSFVERGTVSVDEGGEATAVDITENALAVAFFDENRVAELNATVPSPCGVTWAVGVLVDVSDCFDFVEPGDLPQTAYNIYRRGDDDTLRTAIASLSPEERPTSFAGSTVYSRTDPAS